MRSACKRSAFLPISWGISHCITCSRHGVGQSSGTLLPAQEGVARQRCLPYIAIHGVLRSQLSRRWGEQCNVLQASHAIRRWNAIQVTLLGRVALAPAC